MSFQLDWTNFVSAGDSLSYARVPWDSEIFGFPVFELKVEDIEFDAKPALSEFLDEIAAAGSATSFVFAKVPAAKVSVLRALSQCGFYPVETTIQPTRSLAHTHPVLLNTKGPLSRLKLRAAAPEDETEISRISRLSFKYDRYHLDPNLSSSAADKRFEYWMESRDSDRGTTLVYEDTRRGTTLGFCYLRDEGGGMVDISLTALDRKFQKAGLGPVLYAACVDECAGKGFRTVFTRISTSNIAVLNIYAQLGFSFYEPQIVMHWYRNGITGSPEKE